MKLLVCAVVLVLLSVMAVSCGQGEESNGDNEPVPEEDVYALWKAQPNQKIVFMSKADSSEGELVPDGQVWRGNQTHHQQPS